MQQAVEALAIDFGTSNTLAVGITTSGITDLIPLDPYNKENPNILKTLIYSPEQNQWHFGQNAHNECYENAMEGRMFRSIKKFLPEDSFKGTQVHSKFLSIEKIIASFLTYIKNISEAHFNTEIKSVFIGRPVKFSKKPEADQLAQDRLLRAAHLANFKNVEFCSEPLGAAYEYRQLSTGSKTVLISDFGGGTSDFTILKTTEGEIKSKDVLGVSGIFCAGDTFDSNIMRYDLSEFFGSKIKYSIPYSNNELTFPKSILRNISAPNKIPLLSGRDIKDFIERIKAFTINENDKILIENLINLIEYQAGFDFFSKIESTKKELSENDSSMFSFDNYEIKIEKILMNKDFQEYSQRTLNTIHQSMDQAFQQASLEYGDIELVFCTGGSGKLPLLRRFLEKTFSGDKILWGDNFTCVVKGIGHYGQQRLQERS